MFARIKVSILLFLKVSLVKISIDLLNFRTEGIFSVFAAVELFGSIKIVYLVLIKSWGMFQKSFLIFVPVHTLNRPVWDLPLPWALTHIAQFELHGQAEFFLCSIWIKRKSFHIKLVLCVWVHIGDVVNTVIIILFYST